MPRRPSARVVMNRQAVTAIGLGYADGMQAVGERVLELARPHVPDRPPLGKGLVASGRATTYIDGKQVGGRTGAPKRTVPQQGVATVIGYGFPGRFLEVGTHEITPRPWLTPAMAEEVPGAGEVVAASIDKKLKGVR